MNSLQEAAYERRREEQEEMGECRLLGDQDTIAHCRKPRKLSCGHEVAKGEAIYRTAYILDGEFHYDERCQRCLDAEYGPTDEELAIWEQEARADEAAIRQDEARQAEWERRTERHPSA